MSQPNKFLAAGLKKGGGQPATVESPTEAPRKPLSVEEEMKSFKTPKATQAPSRRSTKHVGGYFDPAVSRQLRQIGVEEDATVQDLLAEAIDLLFQSRKRPTIAQKPAA